MIMHPYKTNATSNNSMLSCAENLIFRIAQIKIYGLNEDTINLKKSLDHEIEKFEENAIEKNIEGSEITKAKYILCAALDEIIINEQYKEKQLATGKPWGQQGLVSSFFQDAWGGERFFQVLDQTLLDKKESNNLVELIYVCLCLGFSGKYRSVELGQETLLSIRKKIYKYITPHASVINSILLPTIREKNKKKSILDNINSKSIVIYSIALAAGIYIGFYLQTENLIQTVLKLFN
jgi:type VI secretion system protein ImpK